MNGSVTTDTTTVLSTATTFLLDMQGFTRHRAYRGVRRWTANSNTAIVGLYPRPLPAEYSTAYLRSVIPSEQIQFRPGATVTTRHATGPWAAMEPTFVVFNESDVIARPRWQAPEDTYDAVYRCLPTGRLG
jgi:hypothetical protein